MAIRARKNEQLPGSRLMKICLISPRIAIQKNDFLGSGIPYWPTELAIFATKIRENDDIQLIDMFGEAATNLEDAKDYFLQGISIDTLIKKIDPDSDIFIIFAISYMSHQEILRITREIKMNFPKTKIGILENSQAVTSYAIDFQQEAFFDAGADFLLCGESVSNWDEIKLGIVENKENIPNLVINGTKSKPIRNVAKESYFPIPAWDLIPYQNYWKLPYSHGPKTENFFPILTSRGCPYPCDFCVVPELNARRWRGRKPTEVVDEIEYVSKRYGARYFQIEDLNPTVDGKRWLEIALLIIERKLDIRYAFVSGTKAETLDIANLSTYRQSGLRYISISPESGSPRLMKIIGKKFDYLHALNLISSCKKLRIQTQTCFIVGHPDENEDDFKQSVSYLRKVLNAGVDEIAVFIISPFAGSKLFKDKRINLKASDDFVSFTPKSRTDFLEIQKRRSIMIIIFILNKIRHPIEFISVIIRSLIGKPITKVENLPRRILFIIFQVVKLKFGRRHAN